VEGNKERRSYSVIAAPDRRHPGRWSGRLRDRMSALGTILFVWRDLTAHEGGVRDQMVVRRVAGIPPGRDLET
jgi:hypothetical protein